MHPISTKNRHVAEPEAIFSSPTDYRLVENVDTPPTLPTNNGSIHTLCQIIKTVMSSAVEAKIGATFINTKDALPIRTTIGELGHNQPPTPMKVDNTTVVVFANNNIKQKRSK